MLTKMRGANTESALDALLSLDTTGAFGYTTRPEGTSPIADRRAASTAVEKWGYPATGSAA